MGVGAFFALWRSRARRQKKRARKKRKRRARKKKPRIRAFSSPHSGIRFQSPKLLGMGKARVLSKMYSSVGVKFMSHSELLFSSCLVLSWLSNPVRSILSWMSCPASPVLSVLLCLSCYSSPVLPIPLCLSGSAYSVLPVLFCLSVLFCLPCFACPFLPVCPVPAVMLILLVTLQPG